MSYHDGMAHAHASDTCAASAAWSHRSSPEMERKASDGLDFLVEIGVEHDTLSSGRPYHSVPVRTAVRGRAQVHTLGAGGTARAFLVELEKLVRALKPAAGVAFYEDVVMLAVVVGGEEIEPGLIQFPDRTLATVGLDHVHGGRFADLLGLLRDQKGNGR